MSSNSKISTWGPTISFSLAVVLAAVSLAATFAFISKAGAEKSADNYDAVDTAIKNISYTNGGLIVLMLLIGYSYTRNYPDVRDNYIFILIHIALFLSLLAVSISVITKRQ